MTFRLLAATTSILALTPTALHAQTPATDPPPVSAVATTGKIGPVIRNGMLVPVAELADTTQWIRERVWVETDFDTDGDGRKDRLHVDVTRPAAAERAGVKLPVIMQSSPYAGGTNGPREYLWNVRQELGVEPPPRTSAPPSERQSGPVGHLSDRLARTWVPRGLIAVVSEQSGTGLSTGCPTIGDVYETNGPKFVIDWLNGRAKAYTTVAGDEEVRATDWTNGRVGMMGGSYLGTLPISAAISGVKGLEAIIPSAPNTSYYHYYRSNGLVRSPGGWLGEDIDFLYDYVHSNRDLAMREACNRRWRDGLFAQNRDRATGDFNEFWEVRDQLPHVKNVRAAVLFVHGFNDYNVVPEHTIRMWEALKTRNPDARIWLHQGGHGGSGPPADLVNRWWAHYLYDVENGIDRSPRAMVVPSHAKPPLGAARGVSAPAVAYADWPVPGSTPVTVYPSRGGNAIGTLALTAPGRQGTEQLVDDYRVSPDAMAASPASPHRLLYSLPAFRDTVHLSGTTRVTIRLASNKPAVNLSVYLVKLPYDSTEIGTESRAGVVTRGWADPQNHRSLTRGGNYASKLPGEPLVPGRFYTVTFDLQPDDQHILPGERLGVMIFSSDADFTLHPDPGTELTVDLDGTSITLPIVGGAGALRRVTASD
ncbi:MAG TPA: Xaa-Pro dipeptidyl-peptidase [Longimicrobiales bacterium]